MGSKRNRFLIRQPRIKRDSDPLNQPSPEITTEIIDPMISRSLLSVPPPKIERHASEPAPSMTPSSPHLLSVPQSSPFLMKQHSHPLLPSQSPPMSLSMSSPIGHGHGFTLHRQLSHPIQPTSASSISVTETLLPVSSTVLTSSTLTSSGILHFMPTPIKQESEPLSAIKSSGGHSPSVILVSEPLTTSASADQIPTLRVKTDELIRSSSSPQTGRELSLENPRSSHCPVIRPGPALGCNFCWNTIDAHGRILRRKTKYHCPECQTNLCIVPCFQEYHERQSSDHPSNNNSSALTSSGGGGAPGSSSGGGSKSLTSTSLRHYPKTGSI